MKNEISILYQAALQALNKGQYRELHTCCLKILRLDKEFADAWFFLSIAAAASGKVPQALTLVDKALQFSGPNVEYLSQKSKFHAVLNQFQPALAAADQVLIQSSANSLVLDTIGVVYSKLGEYQKAETALLAAVKLSPDNAQFRFNLASAQQFLGAVELAVASYEAAIHLKPNFFRAHWALSELEKNQTTPLRLNSLLKLASAPDIKPQDELYLAHAIAREYEKSDHFEDAFQALIRGKKRHRASLQYTSARDEVIFKKMEQAFSLPQLTLPSNLKNSRINGKDTIFIVGMPRSGTTLVERMLSSHSQVYALGELQEMALAVKAVSNSDSNVVLDEEVISKAIEVDPNKIGEHYLSALKDRLVPDKYFIDKMPLNFLYLGFILKALPLAKVIYLRRNPLDTCLSNFRQLFAMNYSYYNYHYDLMDTARYYLMFDRLMAHWQQVFGSRLCQISYEDLTAEPEDNIRKLLSYLDLEWQDECLQFHENNTGVATASTIQVREPLYRSAVGRWQKYREQLTPVMEYFDKEGIAY